MTSLLKTQSWSEGTLFGFDTETTSPDPMTARIVTAAIVIDEPGKDRVTCSWISDPGCEIDLGATAVHGISTEYAQTHGQDAKASITDILNTLSWLQERHGQIPLVMVNSVFDLTILHREIIRLGIDPAGLNLQFPVIDTLVCDRRLDKYRSGRRTLTATCAAYGIVIRGAHTADGDVIASIRLARAMAKKFPHFARFDIWRLQAMQSAAADERSKEFEKYRRSDGIEPDFTVPLGWPFIK